MVGFKLEIWMLLWLMFLLLNGLELALGIFDVAYDLRIFIYIF